MHRRRFLAITLPLAAAAAPGPRPAIRVLFIGNSYTYGNNMPLVLEKLARSVAGGPLIETAMVARGGASLQSHIDSGKAYEALRRAKWDFVVLQEQSTLGRGRVVNGIPQIANPKWFHQAARRLDAEIRKSGAKTLFFLTWAREQAPDAQARLNEAYGKIARELNSGLVAAGIAWQRVRKEMPHIRLYRPDRAHPNGPGTYLAACAFYAAITGRSPEGLPSVVFGQKIVGAGTPDPQAPYAELVNVATADAVRIQRIAWETCKLNSR